MAMNITTTTDAHGADSVTWVIYGQAGSGKTSMLSTVPDPSRLLYVNLERGVIPPALRGAGAAQAMWQPDACSALDYTRQVVKYLRGEGRELYDWVALDSGSMLAEDVLASEMSRTKDPRQAYGEMATTIKAVVRALARLTVNVIIISKYATAAQPEGGKLGCPNFPGQQLKEWLPHEVDGIFALCIETKGRGDNRKTVRFLKTCADGRHAAKDRTGMLEQFESPDLAAMHRKVMKGLAPRGES